MAKTDARPKPDRRKAPTKRAGAGPAVESVNDEAIAARAFEYFVARGGGHGRDLEDWLQAERELRQPTMN